MAQLSLTMEEYLAHPAVGASTLTTIDRKSPLDFHMGNIIETDAMRFGTVAHLRTLEPERAHEDVAVWETEHDGSDPKKPAGTKRVRRGKAWDRFKSDNFARTIVTPEQWRDAGEMAVAVRGCKRVKALRLFDAGEPELTFTHTDPVTGIELKVRPDWLSWAIVELKTAIDMEPRKLWVQGDRLGYDIKAAMYYDVIAANLGETRPFYFVVASKKEDREVAPLEADDYTLEAGRKAYQSALVKLAECRESGTWPGKLHNTFYWEVPAWRSAETEDEFDIEG